MTKRTGDGVDKTLRNLSHKKETPKSAFVLLLLIYALSAVLTTMSSRIRGQVVLFDIPFEYSSLTGVFSLLSNTCAICLVMLFHKVGYITAMILVCSSFPMMFVNVFIRQNYRNIPGFFNGLMVIVAITIIFLGNRKIVDYQNSLRKQAVTDRLTGLPNRLACSELMDNLISRNVRFTLVSADINNFKSINDTMGHDTGNLVLQAIADRWKSLADSDATGTNEFVARITGDEFMFIINDYQTEAEVEDTIRIFKAELEKKITIDDCDYYMTACFGYSLCPEDTDVLENIFTFTDAALHEAKKSGSGSMVLRFTPDVLNSERDLEIERKIRKALTDGNIFYNLQPQYDMEHRLIGFEALARMKDHDGKLISPTEFIPVAEKTGLVEQIDMHVFERAVEFMGNFVTASGRNFTMSVNVSVRHLMKNSFLDDIRRILNKYGVPPELIEIEITESIMIDSAEKALQRIEELKKMGMKIAIDDFGTGYSSLSYLNNFPSDMLKIDKSFIDKMNQSEVSRQYVAMIVSIGHTLNLKVISEGVESPDQVDILKSVGCDYIQGFVWGRPLSPKEAGELVRAQTSI
ncbi:MAG: bifunctional diguanylate cyclase/phosphodiesterase [Saccharofermentans sp.]|nr:bifunctional diguanylate cyclase/phosphodiesterase [Saccharofermentans sp.]